MDWLTSLNLAKNELQNARIQNLSIVPSAPVEGQIYYNSGTGAKKLRYYNGTSWVDVYEYTHPTADGSKHVPATGTTSNGKILVAGSSAGSMSWKTLTDAGAEITSKKGTANGYASLDGSGLVPASQIPATYKEIKVVANIAGRNALTQFEGLRVHVIDATADTSVVDGWAEYLSNGTAWIKTAESESIDVVLDWSNIENIPSFKHAMTSTSDHSAGNWKLFYSNGSGQVLELALGTSGQVLKSGGDAAAPSWMTPTTGTSSAGYATFWTGTNTIGGSSSFKWDNAKLSFTAGNMCVASGNSSFAVGAGTEASGNRSHAVGQNTTASGTASHAEGYITQASGGQSHAEGFGTIAQGNVSHAEGSKTVAASSFAHSQGVFTLAANGALYAITTFNDTAKTITLDSVIGLSSGDLLQIKVTDNTAKVDIPISTINGNVVTLNTTETISSAWKYAIKLLAEECTPVYAGGKNSLVSGSFSHAEGNEAVAIGDSSFAMGYRVTARGAYSHARGRNSVASGLCSYADGENTIASGDNSYAKGYYTEASGKYSYASGDSTVAQGFAQTTIGTYNVAQGTGSSFTASDYAFIIGNGISSARSNAFAVNFGGDTHISSKLGIGTTSPAEKVDVVGGNIKTDGQFTSTRVTGAPLQVSSNTLVNNLNADLLDGIHASAFTRKYAQNIGNGTSNEFTIEHNLNAGDVVVGILKVATGFTVFADVQKIDTDNIKVIFGTAPTLNQYRVTVVG